VTKSRLSNGAVPPDDYRVGYRRPPIAGRFKPGHVANPKGRPKKKKTVAQIIEEGMMKQIKVAENGHSRTVTAQELIILNLIRAAARGDIKAIHALFSMRDRYQDSKETTLDPAELDTEDRKIIEEHLAGLRASETSSDAQSPDDKTNRNEKENKIANGKNNGTPDDSGRETS
jgi:Family of unknown function (DUF5681)